MGEASQKCVTLGVSSALMIVVGYPGELIVEGDLGQRWFYWMIALIPFCYIVYELLVGLAAATASETDPRVRDLVFRAQWVTVVSWLTYPVVYIFPMLGFKGAQAVVNIQVGYCVSDVISKCGVGLIIYSITAAKSAVDKEEVSALRACCAAQRCLGGHIRGRFSPLVFRRSRRHFVVMKSGDSWADTFEADLRQCSVDLVGT